MQLASTDFLLAVKLVAHVHFYRLIAHFSHDPIL